MATMIEIRRENLRRLLESVSSTEVARQAGYSGPSYISQMAGPNPTKDITEKSARRLETGLGLPAYWMDREQDSYGAGALPISHAVQESPPPAYHSTTVVDSERFTDCAYLLMDVLTKCNVKLPRKKFSVVVGMMLDSSDQSDDALIKLAERLVSLSM